MAPNTSSGAALIVVDVQYDFMPPQGSLNVPGGDDVVPVISDLLDNRSYQWDVVVASQDWHPKGHISFASTHNKKVNQDLILTDARGIEYEQRMWPDHCLQGTHGAEIAKELLPKLEKYGDNFVLARKGWHKGVEEYSAFDGVLTPGTAPEPAPAEDAAPQPSGQVTNFLRYKGVWKVVVTGLATDYCVAATALSALTNNLQVAVVVPACRAIADPAAEEVFDKIQALGGIVIGRHGDPHWQIQLESWLASA